MKLTIREAKEKGYTNWLYANEGFQSLRDIDCIEPKDFEKGKIELAEKEPSTPLKAVDGKTILDMVADLISSDYAEITGDDTDTVYSEIMSIDPEIVEVLVVAIKDKLKRVSYYSTSGIELIP